MNILLFGDSMLGRVNRNRINLLESKIAGATIYNAAIGGWNSDDGARRADYMAKLHPDWVVLSFGANDCAPWKEQVPLEVFKGNITAIMKTFAGVKILALLCPAVEVASEAQTREFNELLGQYNDVFKQYCGEIGATYIDLNVVLQRFAGEYHEDDGLHMNDEAYGVVIDEIAKVINKEVQQ